MEESVISEMKILLDNYVFFFSGEMLHVQQNLGQCLLLNKVFPSFHSTFSTQYKHTNSFRCLEIFKKISPFPPVVLLGDHDSLVHINNCIIKCMTICTPVQVLVSQHYPVGSFKSSAGSLCAFRLHKFHCLFFDLLDALRGAMFLLIFQITLEKELYFLH